MKSREGERLNLVSAYGRKAGSSRVRLYDWVDHLGLDYEAYPYRDGASNGVSALALHPATTLKAELRTRQLPRLVSGGNVILSRAATPFTRGVIEEKTLRAARHAVYDIDDAIMVPMPGMRGRLFPQSITFKHAAKSADVVIAGNEYLAERASDYASDVRVIPSCVEPSIYSMKRIQAAGRQPRLVWIGSPSTERYLRDVGPAITEVCRTSNTKLLVISAGIAPIPNIPEEYVQRVAWDHQKYPEQILMGDIGIMPLADAEWERGKCAYKLLQYGAAGLPVVGSPVGANKRVLSLMEAPMPTTLGEWYDAMAGYMNISESARMAAGARARRVVERHFSYSSHAEAWKRAVMASASEGNRA